MSHRVCPWWIGSLLASPVRRWFGQDPIKILSPSVSEGMTVLEPGPGMRFFTIPLARHVGASGKVIATDVRSKMIGKLKRRAAKVNLLERIDARVTSADTMGISDLEGKADFTLAVAMVHEFPAAAHFFDKVARASKSPAQMLLAEPRGHVDQSRFSARLSAAACAGFSTADRPRSQGASALCCYGTDSPHLQFSAFFLSPAPEGTSSTLSERPSVFCKSLSLRLLRGLTDLGRAHGKLNPFSPK